MPLGPDGHLLPREARPAEASSTPRRFLALESENLGQSLLSRSTTAGPPGNRDPEATGDEPGDGLGLAVGASPDVREPTHPVAPGSLERGGVTRPRGCVPIGGPGRPEPRPDVAARRRILRRAGRSLRGRTGSRTGRSTGSSRPTERSRTAGLTVQTPIDAGPFAMECTEALTGVLSGPTASMDNCTAPWAVAGPASARSSPIDSSVTSSPRPTEAGPTRRVELERARGPEALADVAGEVAGQSMLAWPTVEVAPNRPKGRGEQPPEGHGRELVVHGEVSPDLSDGVGEGRPELPQRSLAGDLPEPLADPCQSRTVSGSSPASSRSRITSWAIADRRPEGPVEERARHRMDPQRFQARRPGMVSRG